MATATNGTATKKPLTKDDVSAQGGSQISYEDLYQPLGAGQLERLRHRLHPGQAGLGRP